MIELAVHFFVIASTVILGESYNVFEVSVCERGDRTFDRPCTESTCLALLLLTNPVFPLKCYQCNSTNLDAEPKCDRLYWKQMSTKERDDLIIDCLERLSYFCIVIRKIVGKIFVTTRGCMGTEDSQGTTLSAGCVDVSVGEKACLCTDNLCNAASAPHRLVWTLTFYSAFSFLSGRVFLTP